MKKFILILALILAVASIKATAEGDVISVIIDQNGTETVLDDALVGVR